MWRKIDMERKNMKITRMRPLAVDVYSMTLAGDCRDIERPGRFINITVPGFYLRRPISISDWDDESLTVVFRIAGGGTAALSAMKEGTELDVLSPLGNGFDISALGDEATKATRPAIVGGGIGVPPLYGLAKAMTEKGIKPDVILGFNKSDEIIMEEDFRKLGIEPVITTVDGSFGVKGFVTDAMKDKAYDYAFACGPVPMLKAIYDVVPDGQFSFEARMACGFGACMGCTMETVTGYKRVCKDGPIFYKEEIKWQI